MRRIYESSIKRNSGEKTIFIMLFIGFVLTIWPILIAMSTRDYYDEKFYDSKMVILIITIQFNLLIWGNQFRTISDVNRI